MRARCAMDSDSEQGEKIKRKSHFSLSVSLTNTARLLCVLLTRHLFFFVSISFVLASFFLMALQFCGANPLSFPIFFSSSSTAQNISVHVATVFLFPFLPFWRNADKACLAFSF
jgi:hypothetical protein